MSAKPGDCGVTPSFNVDWNARLAQLASQLGVGRQASPVDALHAALTHGSMPYFGAHGGSGVVGMGFPATGWTETSATRRFATFHAPYRTGAAELTFTKIGNRWLLSHGDKHC